MVLYPPQPEDDVINSILGSPRKLLEKQKAPLVPQEGVAHAALQLLTSFIHMNHPLSLVSGLPRYADRNQDNSFKQLLSKQGSLAELETEESYSGKAALQIGRESSFWACLTPEFIGRISSSKDDDDFPMQSNSKEVVGESAWPILSWFVQVIEREEHMCGNGTLSSVRGLPDWSAQRCAQGQGSKILLYQIPAPRTGVGPRWEVNQVLGVIIACFDSSSALKGAAQDRRWLLGSRLLNSVGGP